MLMAIFFAGDDSVMRARCRKPDRISRVTRIAFSYYVTSGLCAAAGLFLVSAVMRMSLGSFAAAAASIGVIVVVPTDQPAPRAGKFWQMFPAALIGIPLFFAVRVLREEPAHLMLLLVPATFVAFLCAAWGRRGIPMSVSAMFAVLFAMAVPSRDGNSEALLGTEYFAVGAIAYLLFATFANHALNGRYRVQLLADALLSMASLMRIQSAHAIGASKPATPVDPVNQLLRAQAALADQLQIARDMLLESPQTPRRLKLAGMLLCLLEIRDRLLACELDVDLLGAHPDQLPVLQALQQGLGEYARQLDAIADALLWIRLPPAFDYHAARSAGPVAPDDVTQVSADSTSPEILARGLASRVGNIGKEIAALSALARGDASVDLSIIHSHWQMFISPTGWSWQPILGVWHWDAPPLRHAIRAALAIATAFVIALVLPWGTHAYWILITIVVVLRGSLAQTLERRNSRVAGTLLGSAIAGALLALHTNLFALTLILTLAQAVAHAFAIRRYLITAVAATVLALLQAHLLNAELSPAFDALERVADTLVGVGVAWAFSYVLPAWERTQIPALIARALEAQGRHARLSLEWGQLSEVDDRPELQWRLARREAYDSVSALVQAMQRCLSEPRAVRPPLEPLSRLLTHGYQLMAQLTAVKTMLVMRRGHLDLQKLQEPLKQTIIDIERLLANGVEVAVEPAVWRASAVEPLTLPDPFGTEMTPWLLRRLNLATTLAQRLRDDARRVLQ